MEIAADREHERAQDLAIALHRHGDAQHQIAAVVDPQRARRLSVQGLEGLGIICGALLRPLLIERQRLAARNERDDAVVEPGHQGDQEGVVLRRRQHLDLDLAAGADRRELSAISVPS